jgi:4-hydroxy-3-methylbut-2-en-1-yl diphosphate reductase
MGSRHRSDTFVLLCALPPEALSARIGLGRQRRRSAGSSSATSRVLLTGMGPQRARKAASRLASSLPDGVPVVVVGVGGALLKGYVAGDLVVASAFGTADAAPDGELEVVRDPAPLDERSRDLGQRLREALSERFASTTSAPLLSASRTARGREREVLGRSGAAICDTESAWLARLAERRPFAVVRSIVDTPERELVSLQTVTGGVIGLKRLADASQIIAELLFG